MNLGVKRNDDDLWLVKPQKREAGRDGIRELPLCFIGMLRQQQDVESGRKACENEITTNYAINF